MREIIFRGKRTDNGEWAEGYLTKRPSSIQYGSHYSPWFIDTPPKDPDDSGDYCNVIRETVGQYTGLTDKNGKRIFEGDILKIARVSDSIGTYYYPPLVYPVNVIVKWDLCAWMWETLCDDKRYIGFPDAWCHYECEVIGNIHDNPELKGGE